MIELANQKPPTDSSPAPLLLTPRDAARRLAVSERTLWSLTRAGSIPRIKLGRIVRYDPEDLRKFVDAQKRS
jgi:excisionase family DNA binding protein